MKKSLSIIGGGSCALFLANVIDESKYDVTIYEHNAALGRKFLVAGDGGLNLTHSEPSASLIQRYTPSDFLKPHVLKFDNRYFMNWLEERGVPVYVGSSGRVFPKSGIKPVQVLAALMKDFAGKLRVQLRADWKGFVENDLVIELAGKEQIIHSDVVVFCLGGASWPVTGSTGSWREALISKGVQVEAFQASNCSFVTNWPQNMLLKLQGKPIKNCKLSCEGIDHLGEVVITKTGIEGSGIYPLSAVIRGQLKELGVATVYLDLKPQNTVDDLLKRLLSGSRIGSYTDQLRQHLNLTATQIQLLKSLLNKEEFLSPTHLCAFLKSVPVQIIGLGTIEDAISTVGGISLHEIDDHFQIHKMPGHYAIGEMLNYDAPTGGYLLQSCFSMAMALAEHLNQAD